MLDIGTPPIQALPVGTRIAAGFVQSAAVRAAGFAIVPIAQLAPAVKYVYFAKSVPLGLKADLDTRVLYTIMMVRLSILGEDYELMIVVHFGLSRCAIRPSDKCL